VVFQEPLPGAQSRRPGAITQALREGKPPQTLNTPAKTAPKTMPKTSPEKLAAALRANLKKRKSHAAAPGKPREIEGPAPAKSLPRPKPAP
jgi:hypothetical protein